MGRRKTQETLPEIRAELAYAKEEMRKAENKVKLISQGLKKDERSMRTSRLCNEAGILESYVPALKTMNQKSREKFIQTIGRFL